jgi:hypothetical protein
MSLIRVGEPARVEQTIAGLFPDTFSGPEVTITRFGCEGDRLVVRVKSEPKLFQEAQTVSVLVDGRQVSRLELDPEGPDRAVVVPLPEALRCEVKFLISPTAVPSEVVGGPDTRVLGVHVLLPPSFN